MHIPDGFIAGGTAAAAGVVAAGGLGVSLRAAGRYLQDRQIPLAGLLAAFIFVLQMLNFPVAAGTSGHIIGAALAAILLGPSLGVVVMAVVIIVQALLFADGGISALGLNLVNLALVAPLVGWYSARAGATLLPRRRRAMLVAAFSAAWLSVIAASSAFVVEYWLGGAGDISMTAVFWAMTAVHGIIGIGEGLVTVAVVGAVLATRPDLVRLNAVVPLQADATTARGSRRRVGGVLVAGVCAAVALAWLVAPIASGDPDGLERVAIDQGFAPTATDDAANPSPLSGYGVTGIEDDTAATGVSGTIGIVAAFAAGAAVLGTAGWLFRRSRSPSPA